MRSDAVKHLRNQAVISELKTLSARLVTLKAEPEKARELAARLVSRYDAAVNRGIIPRGRADRRKSRVAHFLAKLSPKKKAKASSK